MDNIKEWASLPMPELSQGPPADKTGRGSLLNSSSCPADGQETELNCDVCATESVQNICVSFCCVFTDSTDDGGINVYYREDVLVTLSVQDVCASVCCVLTDSTDDDGIKAYHWEEVSGPLQEHQINDDTQTLKLKDMAPGFYVFRSVVGISS